MSATTPVARSGGAAVSAQASGSGNSANGTGGLAHNSNPKQNVTLGHGASPGVGKVPNR